MKKLALAIALIPSLAWAQQPPAPTAQEQIERTIGSLFVSNTNLTAQLQALSGQLQTAQADLAKAQAKIKELEEKGKPVDAK